MNLSKFQTIRLMIVCLLLQVMYIGCNAKINYDNDAGVINPSTWVYNFGYVKIGDTESLKLEISNCGKQTLHIERIGLAITGGSGNIPGSVSDKFGDYKIAKLIDDTKEPAEEVQLPIADPIELKKDQNITVTIDFSPSSTLPSFAALEITHDGINKNPAIVELMSVPQTPEINVTQDSAVIINDTGKFSFGDVAVGSSSQTVEFKIENLGIAELQIGLPEIIQGDTSQFMLGTSQTSQNLASGDSTTFWVQFNPTSEGEKTAIISISSNDPDENPFTFIVFGNRIPFAPSVYGAKANPDAVSANGKDEVVFSAHVEDKNGIEDIVSVTIDLTAIEGKSAQQLYDDGSNSDDIADDGIFSCKFTMPNNPALYGVHELTVTATDSDGLTGTGVAYLGVASGNVIHVDASNGADDDKGYWHLKSPMPTARVYHFCALVNDKIYVIGGDVGNYTYTSANEMYDPVTDTWTQKEGMNVPRWCFAIGVINNKIYAIGGQNSNGDLDSIEEYNPQNNIWNNKTNANCTKRNMSYTFDNTNIYTISGDNPDTYSKNVDKYNPVTETWTTLTALNKGFYHSAAAIYQNKIYVTGGFYTSHYQTLSIYDISANTWDYTKSDMQNTRHSHALVELDGKIYAIGGGIGSVISDTVEYYNPNTDVWNNAPSMNVGRHGHCAVAYNNRIYVFGGSPSTLPTNTVEMFVPKGDGTEEYPFRTIQRGIQKAENGDLVWVHDGIYKGGASTDTSRNRDLDFNGKKIIVFGNPSDPAAVTIDCEGTSTDPHRGFKFDSQETNDSILCGIQIQNGYVTDSINEGSNGGGVLIIDSSPTIRNCKITSCSINSPSNANGGGLHCKNSSAQIISTSFLNCYTKGVNNARGGAIYNYNCSVLINNCIVVHNITETDVSCSQGAGIDLERSSPTIENTLIALNETIGDYTRGAGVYCYVSSPVIKNCTIAYNIVEKQNTYSCGGGVYSYESSSPNITDTIIYGNIADEGNELYCTSDTGTMLLENCCVDDNSNDRGGSIGKIDETTKGGNITKDPRFVVGARGVYYLEKNGVADGKTDSPCIDAGSTNTNTFSYLTGTTTYVDNSEDTGVVDMGYHYPAYSIRDIYVDAELGDDKTGDGSESKPYKTIQKGIDVAGEGDIVWVESGTYRGDGNRDLDMHGKAVQVKGKTGDPDDVIIDCEGSANDPHRGFYFHSGESLASQIHFLTICHGFAKTEYLHSYSTSASVGGGICCINNSSPTINNCVLRNNISKSTTDTAFGGGIQCKDSNPHILGCIITNNVASSSASWSRGGGVSLFSSSPLIENCEIVNNSAELHACGGGGFSIDWNSNAIINDCLIANNKAITTTENAAAGGIWTATEPNGPVFTNCTITNNTVSGRTESKGGGVSCGGGYPVLINSIVLGNNSVSNEGHEIYFDPARTGEVYFDHCSVGNDPGDRAGEISDFDFTTYGGNIADDPVFAKGMNGNYYLDQGSSLCVNGGSGQATDYAFLDGRTTSINGESDTGIVDMGYHYLKDAQGPYAIGWIGGGSDGWQTDPGTSSGTESNSLNTPWGVFVDTDGTIYVAEPLNHRVSKWDKDGNSLGWIGGGSNGWKTGNAPSIGSDYQSFNRPLGVFVDSSGFLYVTDQYNDRVCKWDKDGIAIGWIGGGETGWQTKNGAPSGSGYRFFDELRNLFVDSSGNIYVADEFNNRICKWDKDGNAIGWIGGGSNGWRKDSGASSSTNYQSFDHPVSVFVDSNNDIFVGDWFNHRVSKWDKDGNAIGWIGGGETGWHTGAAPSPGADYRSFYNPMGLFVNSSGCIYITEDNNNRISKWDVSGYALGWIGGGSNGLKTGTAPSIGSDYQSFHNPQCGVFVDTNGYIYITDSHNHRISKWKIE